MKTPYTRHSSEKKIAGAGLDVFEKEPIDPSNPLLNLDNIVMTPHIASASIDTRTAMTLWPPRI